jgi:hypothetical protein
MDRQRILEHYVCGHRDQSLEATRLFDLAAIKFESALQFSYDDESVLNRYRCHPLFCLHLTASHRISPHLTASHHHHPPSPPFTTLHHPFTTLSLFLASIPLQVRGNVVPTRRLRCQHQQCGRRGGKFVRLQSKSSKSHCHVSKNGKLRWCTVFDGEIASRRHVCRSVVRSISCHRRHGSLVL